MMVREDGPEKTKQLFVGAMVLILAGWLLYQFWFGEGLFEGRAFNDGPYGSGASEMVKLIFFLIMQVGALTLGLFRFGIDILKSIGSFFVGSSDDEDTDKKVLVSNNSVSKNNVRTVLEVSSNPLFRTNDSGLLYRDLELEKQLAGPKTPEELTADAVDALMEGDQDRLSQRFNQLHPDKVKKQEVEIVVDESK